MRQWPLLKIGQMRLLSALPPIARTAKAVELRVHHSVIKKLLAEQGFTGDGRKYVQAHRAAKYTFACLETPELGEEKGRLKIPARFRGLPAKDFFGRCHGLGDLLLVAITSMPSYDSGFIRLKDANEVSEDKDRI